MKLRYLSGGAGGYRMPETAAWGGRLGRHWSHEFAERIVQSPDETTVWLITKAASFRKFTDLGGSGVYATALPRDEYRELEWLGTGNGWALRDLDNTVSYFRADGLWDRTEDRQNPTQSALPPLAEATYDGSPRLTAVTFRDGTRIDFLYYASGTSAGMLQTLRRVGVGGSPTSDWTYTWSNTAGRDLTRINRPDGSRWDFLYDNAFPRHMSRATLVGVGGSPSRIEGAWAYDSQGRLSQAWKGSASFSTGMEKFSWNYASDTETRVIDSYGNETTYTFSRDSESFKPRLLTIAGECGTCGTSPNSSWTYDDNDPDNPMRAISVTDGNGVVTEYEYDSFGRMTYMLEAAGVAGSSSLPRETEWQYHPTYQALLTSKTGPTKVGEAPTRVLSRTYDLATGNLESESREGLEENYPGGSFDLTTEYLNYNAAGRVEFVDPPAFGSSDRTRFSYDVPGREGTLPDRRFDPLIATATEFEYDSFNRRTEVTDPNGAITLTEYDALDRVTRITAFGAPALGTDDRVTTFTYNNLGDLFCVKRPDLVGTAFLYDAGGRLIEEHRGTAIATPTSSNCLQSTGSALRERTLFVLNASGARVDEVRQRTTTSTFATPVLGTPTTYQYWRRNVYSSACHLDKVTVAPTQSESVTEYEYDCAGNLSSVWDPLHLRPANPTKPSTSYAYDEVNRLIENSSPWGSSTESQSTTYRYDAQDHLVSVLDSNGIATAYNYSDRDLLTSEESVVSGITNHSYNEHGELTSTTDARGVTVNRVPDAADRIQSISYPDTSLNTIYTYGDEVAPTPPPFSLGRLVSIARGASTIAYTWSGHGQRLTDGALGFTYNLNGLPATISYPGGLVATYGYDKMNRETSLSIQESPNPAINIILGGTSAATYKSFGPLTSYTLGTTTSHAVTRGYSLRYTPTSITVAGSPTLLNWTLGTDLAGNLLTIDDTLATNYDRVFAYQDYQYYLATASGPWGPMLAWTYDKVGNRLTQDNPLSGPPLPDYTYNYETFGFAGARSAKLTHIVSSIYEPAYSYTEAGHVTQVAAGSVALDMTNDDAGQISLFENPAGTNVSLDYDGRGFLWEGLLGSSSSYYVRPIYDSSGGVLGIDRKSGAANPEEKHRILYFAGAPIAIWKKVGSGAATTTYLTTDHIGTPIHALGSNGATVIWSGGFEPFGRDWNEYTPNDALSKGIFLRLPGQWVDDFWRSTKVGANLYYNLNRWYEPSTGRYTRSDPEGLSLFFSSMPKRGALRASLEVLAAFPVQLGQLNLLYAYADQSPHVFSDPTGTGPLKWLRCFYYTPRCLNSAFECKDIWRACIRNWYANDDYDKLQQNLDRAGVATEGDFIYKFCFTDNENCVKAIKHCSSPPVFKP